jgi:uncharacterized membrane protein YbhN (UPF0104 family)
VDRRLALVLRLALLGAMAVLLWLFIRELDWHQLGVALRDATWWPLLPAIAIAFGMLWCAAFGLRIMLAPRHAVSTPRLFRYTIVAYAASVIAPARAGELVRLWLLKQRDGVPIADAAAAVVAQKVVDGLTMILFVAPTPLLVPDLPTWVGRAIAIVAAITLVLFVVLYVAVGRQTGEPRTTWLGRFIAGMHVLRSPRRLWLAAGAQLLAWAIDLVMVACVLHAVGIELPVTAGLLILFTLNLTIIVPTPANLGSLEVGVFAATRILGVDDERALAFALLYHACLVVPILVAGLALELRLLLGANRWQGEAARD